MTDSEGTPLSRSEQAVVIADAQGRYIGATPAALALLGFELAELCTRSVADLTAPDQQDLYDETWASFQRSGSDDGFYTVVTGSGEAIPVRYRAIANVMPGIHLSRLERL